VISTLSATNRSRQKVLGYPVDVVDQAKALAVIESAWAAAKSMHIVTLNAEMVVQAQQDSDLDRIVRHAHLIVPDGAGVVWAVRLAGDNINRLPGIELASATLDRAAASKRKVALLGGKPEVLQQLLQTLPQRYPGLNIVASHDGYFKADDAESVVDKLSQDDPELVLVALGVPKQEYFIDRWAHAFPKSVLIGVGGSFDVWTGQVQRAPKIMRDFHLEWLYRLFKEPWRWRRMGSTLPNFGLQVLSGHLRGADKGHGSDHNHNRANPNKGPGAGHDKSGNGQTRKGDSSKK
jgi:N-acetylglucosaminyldiphosphoundecaprenol N-acetyl-beta-D-mannosaminyltransferase